MKNLKIYVQKPWKVSDCASYKLLKEFPPEGVEYANMGDSNLIQHKKGLKINNFLKKFVKGAVKVFWPSMLNAHYTRDASEYDLIHCEHCLSKNNYPWICNMEYVGQLWATGTIPRRYNRNRILKILQSPHCKKIITWTDWARKDIVREFPEIEGKTEVVYPGVPTHRFKKIRSNKIRLLYVSRRFYFKGGLYALEVMDRLTKKYDNVEGVVISDVPAEVLKKYSENKKIKISGMIPQKELFEKIYPSCDIFLYPSFTDTFGFAIIEAMGFGLPVVSVGGHSRKELIEEGKTGFVVENPYGDSVKMENLEKLNEGVVNNLGGKTEKIILDDRLRIRMGVNCQKVVKAGKFSIVNRNKRLEEIYLGALK